MLHERLLKSEPDKRQRNSPFPSSLPPIRLLLLFRTLLLCPRLDDVTVVSASSRCLNIFSFSENKTKFFLRLRILPTKYDTGGQFSLRHFSSLIQECTYGAHLSAWGLHGDRTAPVLFSLHVSVESDSEQSVSVQGRNDIRPCVSPRTPDLSPRGPASEDGVKPNPAIVIEKP